MSSVAKLFNYPARHLAGYVGLGHAYNKMLGNVGVPDGSKPTPPTPPEPASYDDASSAANQAQDLMRRRRGVLANIYAGSAAQTPSVATKTLLGT